MNQIKIPDEAVKYILFQRTAFLKFPNTFTNRWLDRIIPFSLYYKHLVKKQAKCNSINIKTGYIDDMRKEYLSFKDFLPKICTSILDVGCGVAGIDIFLNEHYRESQLVFYLLDKTRISRSVYYLFRRKGAFYNSLEVAKDMLIQNDVLEKNVHLLEATNKNEIVINGNVDLAISLLSWGFHYPIETYLNKVYDLLNKGGSLIIDIRIGTNGINALNNIFNKVEVILTETKYQRVLATK
jgi:SAM-dependent methyltransferase